MRRVKLDDLLVALGGLLFCLLILLLVVGAIWEHFAAPCDSWIFTFAKAGDLPARCVVR